MAGREDFALPSYEQAVAYTDMSSSVRKDGLIMAAEGEVRSLRIQRFGHPPSLRVHAIVRASRRPRQWYCVELRCSRDGSMSFICGHTSQ